MRKISISMLVLLIVLAAVVVSPAFSFEAAGESSYKSVAKGSCPAQKAECDKDKKAECDRDGSCQKDPSCEKGKSSCPKGKSKGSCNKSKGSCGR